MAEPASGPGLGIKQLILVPSLITLVVTILRLIGELQHWSPTLFSRSAGGGGAIIGIVWLVPIFGIYYALKLAGAGQAPKSFGKSIGFTVLGIVIVVLGGAVGFAPTLTFPGKMAVGIVLMALGAVLVYPGWPALFKTLVAYGYAARIPVAIVMFLAIRGNWGTHYDVLPPEYKGPMDFWGKYFEIALLPQLIFWVVFTVVIGSLFGSIVAAIARRGKPAAQAAT
jgi:hypothetical protein